MHDLTFSLNIYLASSPTHSPNYSKTIALESPLTQTTNIALTSSPTIAPTYPPTIDPNYPLNLTFISSQTFPLAPKSFLYLTPYYTNFTLSYSPTLAMTYHTALVLVTFMNLDLSFIHFFFKLFI